MRPTNHRASRLSVGLCACAALISVGCDGTLTIDGQVVSATGIATSIVYIDEGPPKFVKAIPVEGAIIHVVESPDRKNLDESAPWQEKLRTDANGRFHYFSVTCPCDFDVSLSATANGFRPYSGRFRHHGRAHNVTIVLAAGE
jgi:hypothetical protein